MMDHPMVEQIMRTGYPLDNQPVEHRCEGFNCNDIIEDDVFELDGYIYCSIDCLTKNTDVNYGDVHRFK